MKHRINRKIYNIYAFDLESHNDEESIAKMETSMWLACLINETHTVDNPSSYYYNMNDVLTEFERLSTPKGHKGETRPCKNVAIFIWNLSFEWSFILSNLDPRFTFKERIEKDDEYVYNSVSTKSCSNVWQVQLKFKKNSGIVLLRDLSKVFPGSLRNVALSFGLKTQKGDIDYRLNRLHNHIVTDEEREYCFKDTKIIMDMLEIMDEKNDKTFWNSISAGSYSVKNMIKRGWERKTKPYKEFRELYPEISELSDEAIALRKTVGGGITYAPSGWQFKQINNKVGHIDLHQAHPSSAFFHQFPTGYGEYFKGIPMMGKICACHIRISYDDVRLHSIISLIGIDFISDREIWVWDFEIPTMKKCYVNLSIEYIDGYAYNPRPLPWKRYYSDNYQKRLEAKKKGDLFNVMYFKLLNNSSYGKLLEKPHNQTFVNIIRPDGVIDSEVIDKEEQDLKLLSRYTYLPVGSCIPAYTRVTLIEGALSLGWENVVYFDTDSIFFIWNEETEHIWNTKFNQHDELGGWSLEEINDRAQFTAPKRYKLECNGKTTIKAGGINFDKYKEERNLNEIPYDEINIISEKFKVQRAYRCRGGTLIEFQEKEINIQPKYLAIYERNCDNNDV